jgi:hypothetical protein
LGKAGNRVKFLSPLPKFFQSLRLHIIVVMGSPEMLDIRECGSCASYVVQLSFGHLTSATSIPISKKRASTQLRVADMRVGKHFAATPKSALQFAYIVLTWRRVKPSASAASKIKTNNIN